MPPCPISPPPPMVIVPTPWDAPVNWLVFGAVLVAFVVVYRRLYAIYWEGIPTARKRRAWRIMLIFGVAATLTDVFITVVLYFPWLDRMDAWSGMQIDRFVGQPCNLDVVLYPTQDRLDALWQIAMFTPACLGVCLLLAAVWLVRGQMHS